MNLKPKNYEWVDFYDKLIDLTKYTFSRKALYRRFKATPDMTAKWMNFMRATSWEGYGRIHFFSRVREKLIQDKAFRKYFEGETCLLPNFYMDIIEKDLGIWWKWLPKGALEHNPNAYLQKNLKKTMAQSELTTAAI